jgi:hypothetical protein
LNPLNRDFVVDLIYRGDYTLKTRKYLQKHVVNNDFEGLKKAYKENILKDFAVPPDRHKRRLEFSSSYSPSYSSSS